MRISGKTMEKVQHAQFHRKSQSNFHEFSLLKKYNTLFICLSLKFLCTLINRCIIIVFKTTKTIIILEYYSECVEFSKGELVYCSNVPCFMVCFKIR